MSWTLIEHQALTSSVASVTLGSGGTIPQTYKTLKLVVSGRSTSASSGFTIQFNGSSSNFTTRILYGTGSSALSGSGSTNNTGDLSTSSDTANTFGSLEITIPNYTGSTNKPFSVDLVTENNGTAAYQELWGNLWSNTAAISSITAGASSFASGSTFTLYGLA